MHHATREKYPIGEEFGDRCSNNEGLSNALNDKECGLWIVVYRGSKDTEQKGGNRSNEDAVVNSAGTRRTSGNTNNK
jgi:hypothetical protein